MSGRTDLGDSESSLPSWISDHLGEKSYMTDEVNMSPSSPRRDFSSSDGSPPEVSLPSFEKENIMTLDDCCDELTNTHSPLSSSGICVSLNKNPKPDQEWLYFKARTKKTLFGGYPSNVKGWKEKFFFISEDGWEFPEGAGREVGALTILRNVKRLSLKKIGEKVAQSKGGNSVTRPTLAKGMGNEATSAPETKKKSAHPGDVTCSRATPSPRLGDGTSTNLGTALGPSASILSNSSVVEKLLRGVNPPADKEKMEKLTLDQKATRLFHVIGQTLDGEMEQQLAEAQAREQQVGHNLAKMKEEWHFLYRRETGVFGSGAKGSFESSQGFCSGGVLNPSPNFLGAVEDADSKYFGKGFDFCKRQLRRHHPNLTLPLIWKAWVLIRICWQKRLRPKKKKEKEDGGKDMGDVNPFPL
ncbi:hypothetical protein Acr_22g0004530 [Actinidia rufa]|uniref:Uncharacterized protein n=1 Tax=Actinidia rufa TaxID=165716 RepID=A0A7J0GJU8_9ERIC|nr:hypothetical protein Acr_22g0004530 [Actinidia rufa]